MNLQETKKFYLIDSANIDLLTKRIQPSETKERMMPIINREYKRLDKLMLDIVNNSNLSDDEKVTEYNKALTEYQTTLPKKSSYRKEELPPIVTTDTTKKVVSPKAVYNPLVGISKPFQIKAGKLFSILSESDQFIITPTGEVTIDNEKIADSNISDLLSKAVNPRFPLKHTAGWTKFHDFLIAQNVPKSLLSSDVLQNRSSISLMHSPKNDQIKKGKAREHTRMLQKWKPYDSPNNAQKRKN